MFGIQRFLVMQRFLVGMIVVLGIVMGNAALGQADDASGHADSYAGRFCEGEGDTAFLRLIDESFAFFHPNPVVPNLSMLYQPDWDSFEEGAGWGMWWIQNSYGFSYAATPFLPEPWFSTLQRSWDFFWTNQGDGKRKGGPGDSALSNLVAPDGALGDAASPTSIIYKQGDGNVSIHDWFYEATAAGLVMQAEILLAQREQTAIAHYLPKMERACDFIERARDPKNGLFLVGPACNLLAPSYGGVQQPDGTFGKGYLAGVSITYLAALDRMVELYKYTGDTDKQAAFEQRQAITRKSLPLLLTAEGYFAKSVEPGGTKHGVVGQEQYGYLEGVANADAVALRVADDPLANSIYARIASYPAIRPHDFLLTNAPGLDDTYWNWGHSSGPGFDGFHKFGEWVNGGVWGTVEGRAILMYYRLGRFEDIRRSASRAMKWAKDFRMDAPWSQCGENTHNPWSDSGRHHVGGIAVMIDNFAIPAATIRGLFDYEYRSDRLILRPRVPGSITRYTQKEPVRFGGKRIYLSCSNGGPKVKSVTVNGQARAVESPDVVALLHADLPDEARVEIVTEGGWTAEPASATYPTLPALVPDTAPQATPKVEWAESLEEHHSVLSRMKEALANEPGADFDREFVDTTLRAFDAWRERVTLEPGEGYYRPITPERRQGIVQFHEKAALTMYQGLVNRMARYAESDDAPKKRIAALFEVAKGGSR